jgi:hypothetical protein
MISVNPGGEASSNAAVEKLPGERNAYIVEACGDDLELRRELAALVEAHEQQGARTDKLVDNIQNLIGRVQARVLHPTSSLCALRTKGY